MGRPGRSPLLAATLLGLAIWLVALLTIVGLGRLFGRASEPAWMCDDTRYTRLAPLGFGVVGPPASPPPGCLP
jgi:hypothetical protein